MQIGATIPVADIGTGAAEIRDYAQTVEGLGFDYLQAPDHVLGANPATVAGKGRVGTNENPYHDPFVLFGFLAGCTQKLGFAPGVLILAQRQAALVAKQAACLDVLSKGRLRLGVGVGWNRVEFTGLNEVFSNRGRRSEEQVQVMQALWSQPYVTFKGRYHTIDDAGINPRPASGHIPVWFGGHAEATLQRTAKYGDGWMPLAYPADETALAVFDKLRGLIKAEGRDPASVGLEVWLSLGSADESAWHREFAFWKKAGVTHVTAHTTFAMNHHKRIMGHTAVDHLAAITRFKQVVTDLL
ncbi:MAG: LLM class F420-dependent oxidoreductase [Rhodopila sp.]|jgi:probable F420-dependent oxidoreductase